MKRTVAAFVSLLALSVAACGSDSTSSKSTEPTTAPGATSAPSESVAPAADGPSGSITVLTNRTDLVDTVFQDYAKTFSAKYPNVSINYLRIKKQGAAF